MFNFKANGGFGMMHQATAQGLQINESSDDEKFIELNKGREGKTVVAITGKELPNSVYLGGTSYARKDGNSVILIRPTGPYGKSEMTIISKHEWDILKKSKI